MTTTFTPGPWEAVEVDDDIQAFGVISIRQPLHIAVNDIAAIWKRGGKQRTAANARLIAAAPEMLEALKRCTNWMESLRASGDAGFWDWKEGDSYTSARAAIAKGTGEQPC